MQYFMIYFFIVFSAVVEGEIYRELENARTKFSQRPGQELDEGANDTNKDREVDSNLQISRSVRAMKTDIIKKLQVKCRDCLQP